jgi:hypothetical protein
MEQRGRLTILLSFVLIAVCAAVAFGPARLFAATNYIYNPPPGWVRTTYLARGLGTWVQNDQTITVSATNYAGNLNAFTRKKLSEIEALPNAKVGAAQQATVCAHHPASYIAYEATLNGNPSVFETVVAVYANVAYEATYVRGVHEPSQYAARMSLTSLCGGNLPVGQTAAHQPQPYRTGSGATPNLGPIQSSQPYGPVAPTVPPDVAPTITPQLAPTITPGS